MSLSQFVYSLAGVEDQIPDSQLPSATDSSRNTPDKVGSKLGTFSDLPAPTSTGMIPQENTPLDGSSFAAGSPSAAQGQSDPPIAQLSSPETPTSLLGYFFGGQTESPEIEKSSAIPNSEPSMEADVTGREQPTANIRSSDEQEKPVSDQAGFGSFLWTLVAGEEEEEGPVDTVPDPKALGTPEERAKVPDEESPRTEVPQPLYRARKSQGAPGGDFTDSDAEQLVERIELGGPIASGEIRSGHSSRKSIMSDMEIKMKLKEAKVSLMKLKEIQKQTNDMLGIKTPSVAQLKGGSSISTAEQPQQSTVEPTQPPVTKAVVTKKFVPRNMKTHVPYRAKIRFNALNAPISDRLKAYPPSIVGPLHAHQPMPVSLSGNFPRDVVVVSSVEARSHRHQY